MRLQPVILLALTGILGAGCATTAKDFKPDTLKSEEGAAIGRVKVDYNGNDYTDQCHVCFSSESGSCYKLDKSGLVALKSRAGATSITRILCEDTSQQHYNIKGADFDVAKGTKTFFGDVLFDWKNKGGFKVSSLFGAIGAIADESSNDGAVTMKVSHSLEPVMKDYNGLTGSETKLPLKQSIVTVGR